MDETVLSPWIDLFYRMNPLIRREMQRAARMAHTHALLLLMPTLLLGYVLLNLVRQIGSPSSSQDGSALLLAFAGTAYYLGVFVMPGLAASAIAVERIQGTMSMLRVSGLGGIRILTGKSAGTLCVFFMMLLAGFPVILTAALYMGGIGIGDVTKVLLVAMTVAFRAASLGFLAFAFTGNVVSAVALAYIAQFGMAWYLPNAIVILPASMWPYLPYLDAFEAMKLLATPGELPQIVLFGRERPFYWLTLFFLLAQTLGSLLIAGPLLVHGREKLGHGIRPWMRLIPSRRYRMRNLIPDTCNPVYHQAFCGSFYGGSRFLWFILTVLLIAVAVLLSETTLLPLEILRFSVGLPLLFVTAVRAATTITTMRNRDTLAHTLMTDLTPDQLVKGWGRFILISVIPLLLAAFIADALLFFPKSNWVLPIGSIHGFVIIHALDVSIHNHPAIIGIGFCVYATHAIFVLVVAAIGIRNSARFGGSTRAILHTMVSSCIVIFIMSVGLNLLVYSSWLVAESWDNHPLAVMIATIISWLLFAAAALPFAIRRFHQAIWILERSIHRDDFGPPPENYPIPVRSTIMKGELQL